MRDRILKLSTLSDEQTVADIASQFGSSGYVVESVPLALYAARSIVRWPLEVVLLSTIEVGGDTDTIASMTGQIAGAWIGASQVSQEMIESLPNAGEIRRITDEFAGSVETLR